MSPVLFSVLKGRAKTPPVAAKLEGVVARGKTLVGAEGHSDADLQEPENLKSWRMSESLLKHYEVLLANGINC